MKKKKNKIFFSLLGMLEDFYLRNNFVQHTLYEVIRVWSGITPSGRQVKTGFQTVSYSASHFYVGKYVGTPYWGGMPGPKFSRLAAEQQAKVYADELRREINEDREEHSYNFV